MFPPIDMSETVFCFGGSIKDPDNGEGGDLLPFALVANRYNLGSAEGQKMWQKKVTSQKIWQTKCDRNKLKM